MSGFRLGGLVAAPYTPYGADGGVQLAVIEKQAAGLVAAGVKGAFVCGTTGEGHSMTTAERSDVLQRWVDVAGRSLKVIAHVGHNSQRDAISLADHARRAGASAVAAMSPFFFRPTTLEQVVEFMRPVAAAAGDLPFYYYHIPSMSGVAFPMADLLAAARDRIPTLQGIKFTHSDLMDFQRCLNFEGGRFEMAWGFDEMLLGALAVGCEAAVGSTYNYAAPLYHRLIESFRRNDLATARQCARRSGDLVAVLLKHGVLRTGKAIMAIIGIDCGPTRPPVPPLTSEELGLVRQELEAIDVL